MLTAMINGETDPLVIADLAKGKMRGKIPDLAQSVTGHFGTHHALMARAILRRLDLVEEALKESDEMVADACQPWAHQIEFAANHSRGRRQSRPGDRRSRDNRAESGAKDWLY